MWRKGRHYSLKNSLLMQKTDSENKRIFPYPRYKASEKGTGKVEIGKQKATEKDTQNYHSEG